MSNIVKTNNVMYLTDLTNFLDSFFNVDVIKPDLPFSYVVPMIYKQHWINYKHWFEDKFLISFHGLMMKNSDIIKKVFLTVFMNEDILQNILKTNIEDVIIISHHPVWDETSWRWFLPVPENILNQLKLRRISLYVLHSPLDNHNIISTSSSVLGLFDAKAISHVGKYDGHDVWIIWELNTEIYFADFIKKLPELFDVPYVNYIKKKEKIKTIAIVPWWGTDIDLILSAQGKWADVYLTGDYNNKLELPSWEEERKKLQLMIGSLRMNLVECSHYATEKIVMEHELLNLIKSKWISSEFIKQENPWY